MKDLRLRRKSAGERKRPRSRQLVIRTPRRSRLQLKELQQPLILQMSLRY